MSAAPAEPAAFAIQHLGRESRAVVRGSEARLARFREALLARDFVALPGPRGRLRFRRRAYMLQDDWPMRVEIERSGGVLTIRYGLCIPWAWIVGFVVMMLLVLPFAGVQRADLVLVLGSLAGALAIYKQRFDCRPDAAYWQAEPRRRWGATMAELLADAFATND